MCAPHLSPLVKSVERALKSLPKPDHSLNPVETTTDDSVLDPSKGILLTTHSHQFMPPFEPSPLLLSRLPLLTLKIALNPVLEALDSIDPSSFFHVQPISRTCNCKNYEENGGCGCYSDLALLREDTSMVPGIFRTGNRRLYTRPIHSEIIPPVTTPCVRYLHGHEKEHEFSVGLFVFPPNAKIPLHDHPGMCVLSKVLYGEVRSKSYDLVEPCGDDGGILANGPKEAVVAAGKTTILYPKAGNVHEFTAGPSGAAVLDVLLPPYDSDEDRDCTFFKAKRINTGWFNALRNDKKFRHGDEAMRPNCILIPIPSPPEFRCVSGDYDFTF